ncbi:MAG: FAD-dependent oxidoreductase [Trueperaceae bacterium]
MNRHVVVIGAGVIGLGSAFELRRRGYDVTVVERDDPTRETTSFGNAGMIVPSHFVPLAAPGVVAQGVRWMANPNSPFYVRPRASLDLLRWGWRFWRAGTAAHVARSAPLLLRLNLASSAAYDDWESELRARLGQGVGLERRGITMLCATEHGLEEEAITAARANELGYPAKVLSAAQVRALEPDARLEVAGGVRYPGDAHLDPGALMRGLQRWLESEGVAFRFRAHAAGFERENGRVRAVTIQDEAGEGAGGAMRTLAADAFVVAAGARSTALARQVGAGVRLQPGKGYAMTLPANDAGLRAPVLLAEARVAITPLGERLRVGGTMELTGFDERVTPSRLEGIVDGATRALPALSRERLLASPRWFGHRPCSPDGLPYLGPAPAAHNVVIATGHAMLGVSLAPVTASVVARLVAGEPPGFDLAMLDPGRHGRA